MDRIRKIAIRKSRIAQVDVRDFSVLHWTDLFYFEVCADPAIYAALPGENPAAAGNANEYQVDWVSAKRVKKKTVTVLHPVSILSTTPNGSNTSVTLATSATQKTFAKGGQITVITAPPNGVSSAGGALLSSSNTVFTILPRATGVTPG